MGVYERKREEPYDAFKAKATSIRAKVIKLAHDERVIPKSYRLTFAVPMCETAREIVGNVKRASAFYPNTSFGVVERKRYLTLAYAACELLENDIACLKEARRDTDLGKVEALMADIDEEKALLHTAAKRVRLLGNESVADRLERTEAEARRLRDLLMLDGGDGL